MADIVRKPRDVKDVEAVASHAVSRETIVQALGGDIDRQLRRANVMRWLLDGHVHEGKRSSLPELARHLNVSVRCIEHDIDILKAKLGFMFKTDKRIQEEVAATAGMLARMAMEDRGRALEELARIDADLRKIRENNGTPHPMLLNAKLGFLRQANEAASKLDKFIDMLHKQAATVVNNNFNGPVNNNLVNGDQSNITNNVFSPLDAIRMLKEQGMEAQVGTKRTTPREVVVDVDSE